MVHAGSEGELCLVWVEGYHTVIIKSQKLFLRKSTLLTWSTTQQQHLCKWHSHALSRKDKGYLLMERSLSVNYSHQKQANLPGKWTLHWEAGLRGVEPCCGHFQENLEPLEASQESEYFVSRGTEGWQTVKVTVKAFTVKIKEIYFISNRRSRKWSKNLFFDSRGTVFFCYPGNCCDSDNNS